MNKIIVILGQTATGKSDFAVEIAKTTGSEIISADSRQVYKGMNLGTGKITKKEMREITHHLLDVVSPKKIFTVSDFQKLTNKKISNIIKDNKVPIICGGTGFYIDSVINGNIYPEVPPDKKLRKQLGNMTTVELFKILNKLDNKRAENIDKNNPVRLIRAIEIAKTLGKVPKLINQSATNSAMAEFVADLKSNSQFKILKIGLTLPDDILKARIKNRLISRIKKGMIKEVENLHDKEKISWRRLESLGLEYRYVALYLQKIKKLPSQRTQQAKEEMIEKLNTEIWHYAKRQKTWFKRDKNIIWINPLNINEKNLAFKEVNKFLK